MSLIIKWRRLVDEIKSHWFDAYIVWGAVRDLLLDIEPDDVDIATNMPIESLAEIFDIYDIGKNKDFWIVVVHFEWDDFEVAQFRWDWEYLDWRRPESVVFVKTIEEDLARRDYTVNAMAYDGKSFIDPFGWQEDLKNRTIRFVWEPIDRIKEDHLRIMRALRFAAKLSEMPNELNNFTNINAKIDTKSMDAIVNNSHLLRKISKERITQELIKIAKMWWEKFANFLQVTQQFWMLEEILWPIHKSYYFQHNFDNHPEWQEPTWMNRVFTHIVEAVRLYNGNDPLTLFCILFHDIGKPFSYSFEYDENKTQEPHRHRYKWHDVIWEEFFREYAAKELKLPGEWIDTICYCILNHMNWWNIEKMNKKNIYKIVSSEYYPYLEHVVSCDERSTLCENNLDIKFYLMQNNIIKTDERLNNILSIASEVRSEFWAKREFDKYVKSIFTWEDIISRFWVSGKEVWRLIDIGLHWIITEWIKDKDILLNYIEANDGVWSVQIGD